MSRKLSPDEDRLIRWMLKNGIPGAESFLDQLNKAEVDSWQCPCGCASINISIDGCPKPSGKLRVLADFVFGSEDDVSGIFVFENGGILSGVEVYGLADEAPKNLPSIDSLRPFPARSN